MDGIDAALVEIDRRGAYDPVQWSLLAFRETPYSDDRRERIRVAVEGAATVEEICRLHRDLGAWLAEATTGVCREAGLDPGDVDLVGSHGHTVWHDPPSTVGEAAEGHGGDSPAPDPGRPGSSLQLGNPAGLAEETGVPVVSDFRSADLAAGGQGAPLVPFADALLFSSEDRSRALQNLGGMGNVTWLPSLGSDDEVFAFDTGPGVALLDAAAEMATGGSLRFDRDGEMARRGSVDPGLLDRLMDHSFFRRPPPRSTGREIFGAALVREIAGQRDLDPGEPDQGWLDLLATLAAFTARSVGDAYERWVAPRGVDEVFLTGGGASNPVLVEAIRRELAPLPLRDAEELGVDPDAREAVAFAVLAWAHLEGIPANVPAATGARGPRILGSFTPAGPGPSRRTGAR